MDTGLEPDLKKLRDSKPADKLNKLKEIQKKKKKDLDEADNAVKIAEVEFEEDEFNKKSIPMPQIAAQDSSFLLTEDERRIFRTMRYLDDIPVQKETDKPIIQSKLEDEASQVIKKDVPLNIYGASAEKLKDMPFYTAPETVTGVELDDRQVKSFYQQKKDFYSVEPLSRAYTPPTATGFDEEYESKKKKR